jgi:hypothetical protein
MARPLAGTEDAASVPFWSPDSRYIAFAAGGRLRKVEITTTGSTITAGPPKALFDPVVGNYDVTADGQHFLFTVPNTDIGTNPDSTPITVVLNWTATLRKK